MLHLREPIIKHLNDEGIDTVYSLVTIPRRNIHKFLPPGWISPVKTALERYNLSLYMPITYVPETQKYIKK